MEERRKCGWRGEGAGIGRAGTLLQGKIWWGREEAGGVDDDDDDAREGKTGCLWLVTYNRIRFPFICTGIGGGRGGDSGRFGAAGLSRLGQIRLASGSSGQAGARGECDREGGEGGRDRLLLLTVHVTKAS